MFWNAWLRILSQTYNNLLFIFPERRRNMNWDSKELALKEQLKLYCRSGFCYIAEVRGCLPWYSDVNERKCCTQFVTNSTRNLRQEDPFSPSFFEGMFTGLTSRDTSNLGMPTIALGLRGTTRPRCLFRNLNFLNYFPLPLWALSQSRLRATNISCYA